MSVTTFLTLDADTEPVGVLNMVIGAMYRVDACTNANYLGAMCCRIDYDRIVFWITTNEGEKLFTNLGIEQCVQMLVVRSRKFIYAAD